MQTKSSSIFQYFSTTFGAFPNLNPLQQSLKASALFFTVITIVNPLLLSNSSCFSSQVLQISHQGGFFICISVDDLISQQNSSIFFSSKYCTKNILCTLSLYYCLKTSIPITFLSTDLAALISILE